MKTRVEKSGSREVEETAERRRHFGKRDRILPPIHPLNEVASPERSVTPSPWWLRWRAIEQISRQEVRDAVYGWSLYLAAAVVVLVGVVLVYNTLRSVAESGLEIVGRPFYSA